MRKKVSILTAHFGDFDWTEFLLKRIFETVDRDRYDLQVLVINQDRTVASRERLLQAGPLDVLEFPRQENFFSVMGHDHPWVLDRALSHVDGDLLVVFDSDAHPMQDHWLSWLEEQLKENDAICAEDHIRRGNPHPCFMAFTRTAYTSGISFCEGVLDEEIDTGRMIRQQLQNEGMTCRLIPAKQLFCKISGVRYENMIYHHGSGSFHASNDPRIRDQVDSMAALIKDKVLLRRCYVFNSWEKIMFWTRRKIGKIKSWE